MDNADNEKIAGFFFLWKWGKQKFYFTEVSEKVLGVSLKWEGRGTANSFFMDGLRCFAQMFFTEVSSFHMIIWGAHLNSIHQWIVTIFQKLDTELLQTQANTQGRPPNYFFLNDWFPVLRFLLWFLVHVKGDFVQVCLWLVVDEIVLTYRFHVFHDIGPSEPWVPVTKNI